MIEANNISLQKDGKYILKDVSLRLHAGQLYLIVGPNGAGKSTLVKLLSGQTAPASGNITYNSQPLSQYSTAELARIRAVLSQAVELSFPMKVHEVVMIGRYPHFTGNPGKKDESIVARSMEYFDVASLSERDYGTLSGGEKQRVHFARVLAQITALPDNAPCYLLLDEPLTFLDIYHQHQFMQQIKDLLRNNNIVIAGVVHDLNLALKYADEVILINQGSIHASGKTAQVLTSDNIHAVYNINTKEISFDGSKYLIF